MRQGRQAKVQPDILVVADAHLNGDDPAALEVFLAFLERESKGCGTIVFLGDLFDLWLGPPSLQEDHHRLVADALAGFRDRGVHLAYSEGNRDLFVAYHFNRTLFDLATSGAIILNRGGRRFALVHGDRLNRIDYNYRIWNRLVRNFMVHRLLRVLPSSWTLRASSALERSLRKTNRRFRTYFPNEQCERYARGQFGRGADVVVFGHFHRHLHFVYEADPGPGGEVLVLPDWLTNRSAMRIASDGAFRLVPGSAGGLREHAAAGHPDQRKSCKT